MTHHEYHCPRMVRRRPLVHHSTRTICASRWTQTEVPLESRCRSQRCIGLLMLQRELPGGRIPAKITGKAMIQGVIATGKVNFKSTLDYPTWNALVTNEMKVKW